MKDFNMTNFKNLYVKLSTKLRDYDMNNDLSLSLVVTWEKAEYAYQNREFETAYNRIKTVIDHLKL